MAVRDRRRCHELRPLLQRLDRRSGPKDHAEHGQAGLSGQKRSDSYDNERKPDLNQNEDGPDLTSTRSQLDNRQAVEERTSA